MDSSYHSDSVCAMARPHGAFLGKDKNFEVMLLDEKRLRSSDPA